MTRSLAITLILAVALPLTAADKLRKLSEADVLKLVELQVRDDAIVERIEKTGVAFSATDDLLARLKRAGASDEVLAAVSGTKPADAAKAAAANTSLMLWVDREAHRDCPLHSEILVNGQAVDVFSSAAHKSIDGRLKVGWNDIVVKTTVQATQAEWNKLHFRIGPVHKDPKSKKQVMEPVLWKFDNDTDWSHKDGRLTHRLGPDVREVTLRFRLYYGGPEHERTKLREGDYVLTAHQTTYRTPPVSTTVTVNGTVLTSFIGGDRTQVTITPLLKAGKNEVRVVTNRVANVFDWSDMDFAIAGPAEYSPGEAKYLLGPVLDFKAITGWVQDKKSGQWRAEGKPEVEAVQRTLTFNLERAPKAK